MSQINKPSDYFNTILWTADGTSPRSFTGVGFQPDLVWGKRRSVAADHNLYDVVRGAGSDKALMSNATSEEGNASASFGYLSSLDSDGFTATTGSTNNNYWNNGTDTYVAWNWLAGGTASSNTDGSITSNVSASTTSGFSIVSYTGTGANATVGHGLNSAPEMIIVKNRIDAGLNWVTGCEYYSGWDYVIELNLTDAESNAGGAPTVFTTTPPTSSVYSVGTAANSNGSGDGIIAYCFHSVKGYSKIGSYTGNGSTDGTFIYTGFKPAWVMIKRSDTGGTGYNWFMLDNKRGTYNPVNPFLKANASDAESTASWSKYDFLSNGFKLRDSDISINASGGTYIYMAFAENPLVGTNNIPATAR